MRTDYEINEELAYLSIPQIFDRCTDLLTKIGAINSDTGQPPTADEITTMLIGKWCADKEP